MKLPGADELIVEQEKLLGYLLNAGHPQGASKARYFLRCGFRAEEWQAFAAALREHGRSGRVASETATRFGPRYEVEGPLTTPQGSRPQIRTVWQFDHGQIAPRLITAYPLTSKA